MKSKFVLFLLLSSCATTPEIHHTLAHLPPKDGAHYRNGREFVVRAMPGVKTEMALDQFQEDGRAVFRVHVENTGAEAFDLAPISFGCFANTGPGQVINPETRLQSLAAEERDLEPSTWEDTAEVFDSVGDLASAFTSPAERKKAEAEREAREAKKKAQADERTTGRERIVSERKYWSDHALRRTTLRKGDSTEGDLVCQLPGEFQDLIVRLTLPGGNIDYKFARVAL